MGPTSAIGKRTYVRYIFTPTDYLRDEVVAIKDFTVATAAKFLFENVVPRFGCPKILISNQGTHFVNHLIEEMTEEFQIQHRKTTPYHPQVNRVIEAFNKIMEIVFEKICNAQRDD